MSEELLVTYKYSVVRFWGGEDRGVCFQITPANGQFISLRKDELKEFVSDLEKIIKEN